MVRCFLDPMPHLFFFGGGGWGLLLHLMVHNSRYFLRVVLERTLFPVLECLKKDFILSSLWLITWFDVKSALEIIWSQNISFY